MALERPALSALPGLRGALAMLGATALASTGPLGLVGAATAAAALLARARGSSAVAAGIVLGLVVAVRTPPDGDDLTPRLSFVPVRTRIEGTVDAAEPPGPDGLRFVVRVGASDPAVGGAAREADDREDGLARSVVRVVVPAEPGEPLLEVRPGDRVAAVGLLSRQRAPTNPGEYDARAAWARRGVHARLVVAHPRAVEVVRRSDGPAAGIARLRTACALRLSAHLGAADAGLLRSLLLGDRGALDPADRRRFRDAGAAHILAISGAHVALLVAGLLVALRRAGVGSRAAAAVVLSIVLPYVPFSGSAPPVVRAAAGSTLFLLGRIAGREPSSGVLLALVAAGFLTLDPWLWRDPGFRLSFAAASGMVLLTAVLRRALVPRPIALPGLRTHRRAPVRTALAAGTAAWLGSLPVGVLDLGQVSWVAVPVGLVAVPLSTVAMVEGVAVLAFADVPVLAPLLRGALEATTAGLRVFLDLPALLGIETSHPAPPTWAWYVAFGLALAVAGRGARLARVGAWVTLVALLGSLRDEPGTSPPRHVRLTVLDVGHGQAVVLQAPDGAVALLDAGSLDRPDVGERLVLPALRALRVRRLDLVVVSHGDSDHAGAVAEVLDEVPARACAFPRGLPAAVRDRIAARGPALLAAAAGDVLLDGAWGRVRVVAPARFERPTRSNDGCLVVAVETPHGRVLLPGDREEEGVARMLEDGAEVASDVLLLPHHGHAGEGLDRLLAASPRARRIASAPPSMNPRLPSATTTTGEAGALVVDLGPGGPAVSTPLRPDRRPASGYDPPPSRPPPMHEPLPLLGAALGLVALAAVSTRLAWLTPAGSLGAVVLGFSAVLVFGWAGLAALLAPFLVATLLGKLPGGPGKAGARTLRQVAANGVPALVGCALAAWVSPGVGTAVFLGALSALGADTVATEVGTRFGGAPRSILTWRRLGACESGGVTAAGTLASLFGAVLAPSAFAAFAPLPLGRVLALAGAGFLGGVVDSVLGAALQRKGTCRVCGALVEGSSHCAQPVPLLGGRLSFLDNDAVNLVNGFAAAAIAIVLVRP